MMVIDTSAILAILNLEPEAETFSEALQNDPVRLLSAGTALELSIIVKALKLSKVWKQQDLSPKHT